MRYGRTLSIGLTIIVGAALLLSGCQVGKNIAEADKIVEKAEEIHGRLLAPYHFTCAELYLAQARDQYDHSDFKAATKFADKSLFHAKAAYSIAAEKRPMSANPAEPVFALPGIALSVTPKKDLKKSYDQAVEQLESLKKRDLMDCAPKEFALVETNLIFFFEEWEERDYNKAYDHLRAVQRNMLRALQFMKSCEGIVHPAAATEPAQAK